MSSDIILEFKDTGFCLVNIDILAKKWDHRFVLTEFDGMFRLIKYIRRGSASTEIKCSISSEQALDIIKTLELEEHPSTGTRQSVNFWYKKGQSSYDMVLKSKAGNISG